MLFEELHQIAAKEREARARLRYCVNVCVAAGCLSSRSDEVKESLTQEVAEVGLRGYCQVRGVGCLGLCSAGPLVSVEPQGVLYQGVKPEDAEDIVRSLDEGPLTRLECSRNQPFFQRQVNVVTENSGRIDPERIEDYIAAGGYEALIKALTDVTPSQVIEQVSRSGLRGRGGAGYPTGLKWSTVAKAAGPSKFVICNADEGDPGAFMDRSVLESDPQRVLEGMIIAGYAVGGNHGFIYARAEYPLAVKRLGTAIRQAKHLGFLGNQICGTTFNFDVDVRLRSGSICVR